MASGQAEWKNEWQAGDVITADKLNTVEDTIEDILGTLLNTFDIGIAGLVPAPPSNDSNKYLNTLIVSILL